MNILGGKRFFYILVITALVGAIITAIVTTTFKEAQKEEPKLDAGALFNGTTAQTKDGVLRTSISLSNEGDQTLYDVEISGDFISGYSFLFSYKYFDM